ncbi:MAG TPA: hypothetical protein VKA82_04220 [Rubrobacter sp.]|jgi:hypothetical protein|nr:hypothetical protein [Rubrobacter sp.]
MKMTPIELWTALHGMVLGALFLLAFAGGLAGLYGLRREWLTTAGIKDDVRRLTAGTWTIFVCASLVVLPALFVARFFASVLILHALIRLLAGRYQKGLPATLRVSCYAVGARWR